MLTLVLPLASIVCGLTVRPAPAAAATTSSSLLALPITFPVQSAPVAAYFDEVARPGDIASFPQAAIGMIAEVHTGEKMIVYASWAQAEAGLPTVHDLVDIVMYNPEHSDGTPGDEKADLVGTVQRAAEAAHDYGLRFAYAPDRRFAEESLAAAAPFVDIVLLQGQRLQTDPRAFSSWMLARVDEARTANPDVEVFVQVGANQGTASEMLAALTGVATAIDGVAVWSVPRTLGTLSDFVTLVRGAPGAAAVALPSAMPTSTRSPTPSRTTTRVAVAPTATATPSPRPTVARAATATTAATTTVTVNDDPVVASPAAASEAPVADDPVSWTRVAAVVVLVAGVGLAVLVVLARHRARRR